MNTCTHLKSGIDPSFLPQENRVECDNINSQYRRRRKEKDRGKREADGLESLLHTEIFRRNLGICLEWKEAELKCKMESRCLNQGRGSAL